MFLFVHTIKIHKKEKLVEYAPRLCRRVGLWYTQRMPKRYFSCAALLLAGVWFCGMFGLQPLRAQGTEAAFPADDPFRQVVEPVRVGTEAFEARIQKIRASGREPLGLVLTGGSARAYAHIGVLEVLEAEGIRPDFIVANSMGALVGLLYAAGVSPQTIRQIVETMPPEQYLDVVLPTKGGFLDSTSLQTLIRSLVGDVDLRDLPIPIIVTAEDLNSRRQVEIAEGDFARVMAATFAMPAIFEPVSMGGMTLIDGGVTNLAPVSTAARYSSNLIVSTALYNRRMDFGNPITVLNRAIDLGKTRSGMEDILAFRPMIIRNDVEDISYMAFSEPEFIIERGRKSAASCMEAIKAGLPPDSVGKAPDPALESRRLNYAATIPAQMAELVHGALPASTPHWNWQPVLRLADDFDPEPLALHGQAYAGLSFDGACGRARYGISALYGVGQTAGRQWGLSAQALFNPVSTLRLSGAVRLWGNFVSVSSYCFDPESLEALAVVEWSSPGSGLALTPRGSVDATLNLDAGALSWKGRLGLGADFAGLWDGSGKPESPGDGQTAAAAERGGAETEPHRAAASTTPLTLSTAHAYAGMFADVASGIFRFGPEAEAKVGLSWRSFGAARLRGLARYDLSGAGLVLETEDAFRGTLPVGFSDCVGVVNSEAVWFARVLECSVGETLLIKDIEIGPYFDCAWAGSGSVLKPDAFAAGLTVSFSASMSGLKPFELSLFGGVDNSGGFVLGLRQSRLF